MNRKFGIALIAIAGMAAALPSFANPGAPNFSAALWADGAVYGSKGTTALPAPTENNGQSFDGLFVIINSNNPAGQLPVAEAAPGNVNYNGGRWNTHTVWWTEAGFAAHGTVPVLTSYADILVHHMLGHLGVAHGSPEGGPPPYFQCPLLPVKD